MQPLMRTKAPALARTMLPVAVGAGCMIMFLCVINGIGAATRTAPQSGDIIAFQPTSIPAGSNDLAVAARGADGRPDCVLDLSTLQRTGGSLVVESEVAPGAGAFQVHWAGAHTTAGAGDCGASANLVVTARDLNTLASSAGGYGVTAKQRPISIDIVR